MVKRAPVATIQAGTVQPGHYLVLIAGDVASVGEALTAGRELDEAAEDEAEHQLSSLLRMCLTSSRPLPSPRTSMSIEAVVAPGAKVSTPPASM